MFYDIKDKIKQFHVTIRYFITHVFIIKEI